MRTHPLIVVIVVISLAIYALVRELGHLLACAILGIPFEWVLRYGFLPSVRTPAEAALLSGRSLAVILLSGPIAALIVGYVLLYAIARRPGRSASLRLLGAITCFACLIFDPVYYSVVPLFRLGGEPESLAALAGVGVSRIEIPALILLVLNVILARKVLTPAARK